MLHTAEVLYTTLVLTAEGPQLTFSPTMKIMITILMEKNPDIYLFEIL